MANSYRVGTTRPMVHYRDATGKWYPARVLTAPTQTSLTLRIRNSANDAWINLNGGAAVARMTAATQTNVWRRY